MNQVDSLKLNICKQEQRLAGEPDCVEFLTVLRELRNHIEQVERMNPHLSVVIAT
jgi:hypothetical protein